jgi:hypothetical protein
MPDSCRGSLIDFRPEFGSIIIWDLIFVSDFVLVISCLSVRQDHPQILVRLIPQAFEALQGFGHRHALRDQRRNVQFAAAQPVEQQYGIAGLRLRIDIPGVSADD